MVFNRLFLLCMERVCIWLAILYCLMNKTNTWFGYERIFIEVDFKLYYQNYLDILYLINGVNLFTQASKYHFM